MPGCPGSHEKPDREFGESLTAGRKVRPIYNNDR